MGAASLEQSIYIYFRWSSRLFSSDSDGQLLGTGLSGSGIRNSTLLQDEGLLPLIAIVHPPMRPHCNVPV